jgi:quercetin dioxygenase-like cupin family protein
MRLKGFRIGGRMRNTILIAVFFLRTLDAAQEGAVPVEQEPLHTMMLKNDYVEVMRVIIAPGQSSMLHTHSHDRLAINLSESTVREDVPGRKLSPMLVTHAGDILAPVRASQSFTHRVKNAGNTIFEVVDIELLKRPDGPAAESIATPAAENTGFRAYKWNLAPGISTPEHTHTRPYLIIAATPMQLVMKAPDGGSMEHPVKAGDSHWIDSKVTHTLTNNGNQAGLIVEVELR